MPIQTTESKMILNFSFFLLFVPYVTSFNDGESIIAVPLEEKEEMHIGYILNKGQELSKLAEIYVTALKKYKV